MAKSENNYPADTSATINRFNMFLLGLSRKQKRLVLVIGDGFLLGFSFYAALVLRLGAPSPQYLQSLYPVFAIMIVTGVLVLWILGFYRAFIRAFEFSTVNILIGSMIIIGMLIAAFAYFVPTVWLPRSVPIIFVLLAFVLIGASRVVARWFYLYATGKFATKENVLIYGAGENGIRMAATLSGSRDFRLVGFIDDDPGVKGHVLRGQRIFSPNDIEMLSKRYDKLRVLLCISKLTPDQKRQIFEGMRSYNLQLDVIPSLSDVVSGKDSYEDFRKVQIEDLLGRNIVAPIERLFVDAIAGKTILVTGAGGSIGSEICRQILRCKPSQLIVIENSEPSLYALNNSLRELMEKENIDVGVEYRLAHVGDREQIRAVLGETRANIVYHAAAYKHVPIVEDNILAGIKNNIIGTNVLSEECIRAGVERFVLISTDKAVRPPNVMGATKRVAELILQAKAEAQSDTIFSIVRFGNVLGSSGSVIPLFISQIEAGGPVTVTHKEVTRYFMTIMEASQLVIQAGFLSNGGDVYVLDMGEPVKIVELAELMVQLSGKTIKNAENPDGDIEIKITGLRPGEKLYEELLIDANAAGTAHPKILVANEASLKPAEMNKKLKLFEKCLHDNDINSATKILEEMVSGFKSKKLSKKQST